MRTIAVWPDPRWSRGPVLLVTVLAGLLAAEPVPGARARGHAAPRVHPRIVAGVGARPSAGQSLAGRVLAGATDVWVTGVRGARAAVLTVDGRRAARLRAHRGALGSWRFDTGRLGDRRHMLSAKVTRMPGRPMTLRAAFRIDNRGAGTDQLIAQALARRYIDYGTSLLYRFYAVWRPDLLPAALRGGPASDDTIGLEAAAARRRRAS